MPFLQYFMSFFKHLLFNISDNLCDKKAKFTLHCILNEHNMNEQCRKSSFRRRTDADLKVRSVCTLSVSHSLYLSLSLPCSLSASTWNPHLLCITNQTHLAVTSLTHSRSAPLRASRQLSCQSLLSRFSFDPLLNLTKLEV